jgi:sulfur transfer complex TusBCD TusB component (DsrH family)
MSKIVVDLSEPKEGETPTPNTESISPEFGDYQKPKKPSVLVKIVKILAVALLLIFVIVALGGYFYWRQLKTTPQYSLALLVDAARRNDQKTIDQLIDTDAVVDDFVPQITDKAVELYGRGVAPATIQKLASAIAPFLPAIKERAKAELPNLIRDKTQPFEKIPFWAIAIGANRYLDITQEGDKAFVKSKVPEVSLELTLKRNGERWQVIVVKDEVLARKIAEKIGQDLISIAKKDGIKRTGEKLGIPNLQDIFK